MVSVVIGVDAGTTNIKAAAFTAEGDEVAGEAVSNPVSNPKPEFAEQDMETTWEKTAEVIRGTVDGLDDAHDIRGLGVTGQGDGCWLVDGDGNPVRDAILWSDGRAASIVDEWEESGVGDTVREITGTDMFPGAALPILQWLATNEPEAINDAETVFFCKDWLKFNLTGKRRMDYSAASLPFLDIETLDYSDRVLEFVDAEGLGELRPPIAPATEIIGTVTPDAAAQTGLPPDTPIISGVVDIAAGAIGSGAVRSGDSSSVVGTTAVSQTTMTGPPDDPKGRGFTFAVMEEFYLRVMASMAGTPNIDWAYENIANGQGFAEVESEIASIPVGSDGLLYHPYLSASGERNPFLKTSARAQFIGFSPEHTRNHMMRAVYEGVALAMRDSFEHIDVDTDRVAMSGGGARSDFWCQIFADCLGTPIVLPEGDELGAKGVAMLTGVAVGEYNDLESAVEIATSYTDRFEPDPENVPKYDEWYEFFRSAYEDMFDVWDRRMAAQERLRE